MFRSQSAPSFVELTEGGGIAGLAHRLGNGKGVPQGTQRARAESGEHFLQPYRGMAVEDAVSDEVDGGVGDRVGDRENDDIQVYISSAASRGKTQAHPSPLFTIPLSTPPRRMSVSRSRSSPAGPRHVAEGVPMGVAEGVRMGVQIHTQRGARNTQRVLDRVAERWRAWSTIFSRALHTTCAFFIMWAMLRNDVGYQDVPRVQFQSVSAFLLFLILPAVVLRASPRLEQPLVHTVRRGTCWCSGLCNHACIMRCVYSGGTVTVMCASGFLQYMYALWWRWVVLGTLAVCVTHEYRAAKRGWGLPAPTHAGRVASRCIAVAFTSVAYTMLMVGPVVWMFVPVLQHDGDVSVFQSMGIPSSPPMVPPHAFSILLYTALTTWHDHWTVELCMSFLMGVVCVFVWGSSIPSS